MEFDDVVRARRMVRRFDPDAPVDPDVLSRILAHATRAPSAGFAQGWEFVVLHEAADRERFWAAASSGPPDAWRRGVSAAPVLVLCCSDPGAYLERYARPDKGRARRERAAVDAREEGAADAWPVPYWDVDTGMAALLMLLSAVDAGLGGLFFGVPPGRHDAVREAFGVPSELRLVGVVALGTPAAASDGRSPGRAASPHRPRRRGPAEVVHSGRFGRRGRFGPTESSGGDGARGD